MADLPPARAVSEKFWRLAPGVNDGKLVVSLVVHYGNVVGAQQMVQPDGWSNRSSAVRVRREQTSAPPIASERGDAFKDDGIRQRRSINRSPSNSRVDRLVCNLA